MKTGYEPRPTKFTLTEEHIKLLQRMNVGWQDCESGAPEIDPKRPYGNSDVAADVAEIIGVQKVVDDDDETHWPKGTRDRCTRLHREMETALQVVLHTQSFAAGDYEMVCRRWRARVEAEPA